MQKIHVHNDFDVHLNFTNISTDYISRVEFWTRRDDIFCCCKCDGSLKVEDDSNIVCYLNDHNLGTGKLNYNVIFQIPDSNYIDGYKKVCQHYVSDIFLTSENGDTTVAIVKVLGDEKATDLINRLGEFEKVFDNKQDKLAFDNTPTSGSKNVVYSDGIYNAIKNNKPDLSDYAKKTDLQGLATEQWVNDKGYITSIPSDYITESELNDKGYLTEHQSLTDYAKKSDLEGFATEQWVTDKGYITSIPSDYITESELNSKGYITEHQSLEGYAKKSDLQGLATEQWVDDKGYITSIPDDYVTETELNSKGYITSIPDDYVTESELKRSTRGMATQYWVNNNYVSLTDFIEIVHTSIETVTPAEDTEYSLNSNQYLRIIPADAVKLTFNKSDGTGIMREYHILIDCKTAVPTTEFKGVLWELDNEPVFEKGKLYDIVIRDYETNLFGSWKAYKLMPITILITTSDATAVKLNANTYNLVAGDNSLADVDFKTITDINGFKYNKEITSLDFGGATIKIADLSKIFSNMTYLTEISNINIEDATSLSYMFCECPSLKSLDISKWNVSKGTDFSYMFRECSSLTTLDVSKWNVSKGTNFSEMFYWCPSLKSLDISKWNVSKGTDFSYMFRECKSLTTLDVSKWNVSSATDFSGMFYNCSGLTSLDLSGWDVSGGNKFNDMFNGCSKLTTLDVSNWDVSSATDFGEMFSGCRSLTSLDLSSFNTSSATDFSDMFEGCFYGMFRECISLTSIDLSGFNTSNATKFSNMFYGCKSLTSLDVSHFDTSKATDFSFMFTVCSGLTSLDVSNFKTSNVTNFGSMFSDCKSLTSLDVSHFDTSSATDFNSMFSGCTNLKTLDLSGWNVSKVTDFGEMFQNCKTLTSLDLSGWNISEEADIDDMFGNHRTGMCDSLTTIKMIGCSQETIDKINFVTPASATIITE